MEHKSQGNIRTTLRKEYGLFLSKEGSLIDFYQVQIHKQNKIQMCWWLKQSKNTMGYGVTNIHESQNSLQVKFYKGKVVLGYSKNIVGLLIKKKEWHSINTKHRGDEFCINCGKKYL